MIDNILLIQWMHGIGDNFFTLPAYYLVREAFPKAKITFLVSEKNASIFTGFSGLNDVVTVNRSVYHKNSLRDIFRETIKLIKQLRRGRYNLVIDFTSSGETGLLSLLSGAKDRWGMIKKRKHRFRAVFYSKTFKVKEKIHNIDKYVKLVEAGGIGSSNINNQFLVPDRFLDKALSLFKEFGLTPNQPTLFVQPFASSPKKDWPLNKQLQLAEYCRNKDIQVLFGGSPGEINRLAEVQEKFDVSAGKADLLTTAGLMKISSVVIGGDTGPLHMAVALGKRVIMLMGPTSPVQYGPYQHPSWVLLPKKGIDIKQITLQSVINAVDQAFAEVKEEKNGIDFIKNEDKG